MRRKVEAVVDQFLIMYLGPVTSSLAFVIALVAAIVVVVGKLIDWLDF